MIATIRTRENGISQRLCELDIMQFTESQVRDRMEERGIRDDTFFVCGFTDWGIDRIVTLSECYLLKKCICELYDNDDYIICHLLKKGLSVTEIITQYYVYLGNDEIIVMQSLLKHADFNSVIDFFHKSGTWVNAVNAYIEDGLLLNTAKGFYVRK
ncbi:hypothetical protein ACVR0B_07230 [Streptococcus didelphis]|uniref:hypothetical protein n=1 Tax=Streptococcus didelphis TaxID=102886 RepID=UPI000377DB3B|nr:hypothetical protein [Streptococcus didelphis]